MYPTLLENPQYTAIINQRHHDRMLGYIADAEHRGLPVIATTPQMSRSTRRTA